MTTQFARITNGLQGRSRNIARRARAAFVPTFESVDDAANGLTFPALELHSSTPAPPKEVIERYLDHRFDLLGSGWVEVKHGMKCRGFEGLAYESGPAARADADGHWLNGRINKANEPISRELWRRVTPGYRPIDWQLDFKSGFRYSERKWRTLQKVAPKPGVDIKVPWELGRLQHLPQFALAYATDSDLKDRILVEYRNQVLDFSATNPPGFGVNWLCTMDVALRAANLAVAHWIFRSAGAQFPADFESILTVRLREHCRHIMRYLEWNGGNRNNHYLANICGLLVALRFLRKDDEITRWERFGIRALSDEISYQFNNDGSNFEGSTAYHRLSTEMCVWAMAACGTALRSAIPLHATKRLRRAVELLGVISRHDGRIPLIGDHDSGHIFRISPQFVKNAMDQEEVAWMEDHSSTGSVLAAASGLFDTDSSLEETVYYQLVRALAGSPPTVDCAPPERAEEREARSLVAPGNGGGRISLDHEPDQVRYFRSNNGEVDEAPLFHAFPDGGWYVWTASWLYLIIKCEQIRPRNTVHRHDDQLSVELWIDGHPVILDPGTYVYTPSFDLWNRYRSLASHDAPRPDILGSSGESGMRPNEPKWDDAVVTWATARGLEARVRYGDRWVARRVEVEAGGIRILDWCSGRCPDTASLIFSSGYGRRSHLELVHASVPIEQTRSV